MKKFGIVLVALLAVLVIGQPVVTQENGAEIVRISGTLDYVPEILSSMDLNGYSYLDVASEGVWSGDFEGTEKSSYRVVIEPSGVWDAGAVLTKFEGTLLGDKEGTLVMVAHWKRNSPTAGWFGESWILSGTGDLANIHGKILWWGPGFNPEDPEASPDNFYSAELIVPIEDS